MLNKTADRGGKMKAKRAICALLAAAFALLSFAACQSGKASQASESSQSEADTTIETTAPESGLYDIKSYENSEVFDILEVNQGGKYDEICTTYKFNYLSDGLKIEGYMSIPLSAEFRQAGKQHHRPDLLSVRPNCCCVPVQRLRRLRGRGSLRRRLPQRRNKADRLM